MALTFVLEKIFKQVLYFFKHWYIDGFWFLYRKYIIIIKKLDRRWALFVNLKNMFKPLYQDYSFAGYFIGIGFRLARSTVAFFIYLFITIFFVFVYFVWAMLLPSLIFKTFVK